MNHDNCCKIKIAYVPSDRSFGLVLSTLFAVFAFLPLRSGGVIRYGWLSAAILLLIISFVKPSLLSVPSKVWASFGELLHRLVSPIMLAILFFVVVVPFGVIVNIFRKDPLLLRKEPNADSYWVKRDANTAHNKSMLNQF